MNINELIEPHLNSRNIVIFVGSILFVTLNLYFGYCLAPEQPPKSIICNNEIEQVDILNEQVGELRKESLENKVRVHKECMEEQQLQCKSKIDRYRNACLELKCEVCKARNK